MQLLNHLLLSVSEGSIFQNDCALVVSGYTEINAEHAYGYTIHKHTSNYANQTYTCHKLLLVPATTGCYEIYHPPNGIHHWLKKPLGNKYLKK